MTSRDAPPPSAPPSNSAARVPAPPETASRADRPLAALAAPIFAENLVRTSLTAVDQFMLYGFATAAAAAMSAAGQFAFFLQLLYQMPSIGAGILVSQALGAGRREDAERYALGGLVLVGAFSLVVSGVFAALVAPVLGLYGLESQVRAHAATFLVIYGGASAFMAFNLGQAAVLRAWGHPRDAMLANVAALGTAVTGNWLALYGPFGLPVTGMAGVAWSNVAGQIVAFAIMGVSLRKRGVRLPWRDAFRLPVDVVRGILRIGVPTAGEMLSYNLAQIVIMGMVASLGTEALAAYGLVITLSRYVFIFGVSVGNAGQIKVGWLVGARRFDEAYRGVIRWFLSGAAVSLGASILMNLGKRRFLALFTDDPAIAALASGALLVGLALEPGRCLNTIVIPGLKGSGDVRFPVLVGILFMWGVGVLGARILGLGLGLGLAGIWIAMAADEWLRGLVMLSRWRSGAWRGKAAL